MCLKKTNVLLKYNKESVITSSVEVTTSPMFVWKRFKSFIDGGKRIYRSPHRGTNWPGTDMVSVPAFGFDWVSYHRDRLEVHAGLHAYTTKEAAISNKMSGQVVRKMIIPADTKYIKGDNSEIVALRMYMAAGQDRLPKEKTKKQIKIKKNVRSKRVRTKFGQTKVVGKR